MRFDPTYKAFNPDYKGHYSVDRNMLVNIKPWADRDGDALWRTAIGFICYHNIQLYAGVMSCFEYDGKHAIPKRFPYFEDKEPEDYKWAVETCSRDQVAMAFVSLRWFDDYSDLGTSGEVSFKRSKFSMTPDLWLWLHKYYTLWTILIILQFLIIIPWNKIVRPFYKKPGWVGKLLYPSYSLFITVFMLAVVPTNGLTKFARSLVRLDVEKDNYVLQILCGRWPSLFDMLSYEVKQFRWNINLKEPSDLYTPQDRKLEYNNIDEDLLYAAIKWGYKNIEEKLVTIEKVS